jgi:hypothetical protein
MDQTIAWPPLSPGISAGSGSIHDREEIRRNAQAPTALAARYQTVQTIERRIFRDEFIVPSTWQTSTTARHRPRSTPMLDDASGEEISVGGRKLTSRFGLVLWRLWAASWRGWAVWLPVTVSFAGKSGQVSWRRWASGCRSASGDFQFPRNFSIRMVTCAIYSDGYDWKIETWLSA